MDLLEKGLRHLNYILCVICGLSGLADLVICFRHNAWAHLTDGLLLMAAAVLLFLNARRYEEGR